MAKELENCFKKNTKEICKHQKHNFTPESTKKIFWFMDVIPL